MKKKDSRDCDPDLRLPACHAPAPAADARPDFGVAFLGRRAEGEVHSFIIAFVHELRGGRGGKEIRHCPI